MFGQAVLDLPLFPEPTITRRVDALASNAQTPEEVSFMRYFQGQWMRMFPPSIWSVRRSGGQTTGALERYHRTLHEQIGESQPLFRFLQFIREIDSESIVNRIARQRRVTPRRIAELPEFGALEEGVRETPEEGVLRKSEERGREARRE